MDLVSESFPKQLSMDGIRELFDPSNVSSKLEFIFQIIKLSQDYSGNKICDISDGFCFVKAMLVNQVRNMLIKGDLEQFDVIILHKKDVTFYGIQKDISMEIKKLTPLKIRMLTSIGNPLAYTTFFNHNFVNRKGSVLISEGRKVQNTMNLSQILEYYPHIPHKWTLKANIIKKPEKINPDKPFLIILLQDDVGQKIEGVFFGRIASEYFAKLEVNKWYLFSSGQIKQKKDGSSYQIKFTQNSQIIPIETVKHPSSHPLSDFKQKNNAKEFSQNSGSLVCLTARVLKIRKLSKGRSLSVLDANGDNMQVVLWEEFQDEIIENKSYDFFNFRTKIYNGNVSLQSVRAKSKIQYSQRQLENNFHLKQNKFQIVRKDVRNPNGVLNITQVLDLNVSEKIYKDLNGFLIINTAYMEVKNFFKVQCNSCSSKDIEISPLICKKCSNKDVVLRWNIRCHIMDEKEQIKCVMNEDLCEKMTRLSSVDGYAKLMNDPQNLKKLIDQFSHLQGLFKVKLNPYKENVFYNIVEIYNNNSGILLKKAYKELMRIKEKYDEKAK